MEYGADFCYNQEIIDFKVLKLKRTINPKTKYIEYLKDKKVEFRTFENEKVVFQLGKTNLFFLNFS